VAAKPRHRLRDRGRSKLSLLLLLLATPVFYSLFDDAAARIAPRAWLGQLFRRAPAPAEPAIAGGHD
jgi:hypothetical protein